MLDRAYKNYKGYAGRRGVEPLPFELWQRGCDDAGMDVFAGSDFLVLRAEMQLLRQNGGTSDDIIAKIAARYACFGMNAANHDLASLFLVSLLIIVPIA